MFSLFSLSRIVRRLSVTVPRVPIVSTKVVDGSDTVSKGMTADGSFPAFIAASDVAKIQQAVEEMDKVNRFYKEIKVERIEENVGLMEENLDIGELVRFLVTSERQSAKNPPWFYATHMVPKPKYLPTGVNLKFRYKYKYEFAQGIEPAMNRACKLEIQISQLKLSKKQEAVLRLIADARAKGDTLVISCRDRPTVRENEILCLFQLDQLVKEVRIVAAEAPEKLVFEPISTFESAKQRFLDFMTVDEVDMESKYGEQKVEVTVPEDRSTGYEDLYESMGVNIKDLIEQKKLELRQQRAEEQGIPVEDVAIEFEETELEEEEEEEVVETKPTPKKPTKTSKK